MTDSLSNYVTSHKPNAVENGNKSAFPDHPYADELTDYDLIPIDHDPFATTKSGEPHPPVPTASAETQQMGGQIAQGAGSLLESAADPAIRLGKVVTGTSEDIWSDLAQTELGLAAPELKGAALATKPLMSIFAGIGAKTADRQALSLAQQMAERGMPHEQIWDATGWFQGADQKWRFEIPDQESFEGRGRYSVGSRVHHPELFQAYPDLQNIRVKDNPQIGGASYESQWKNRPESIEMGAGTSHLVMLHELQHAIQAREGFARGGNTDEMRKVVLEVLKDHPPPEHWDDNYINKLAHEAYMRLAGEVESRNVEARAQFPRKAMKGLYPWETESRPREKQTVRGVKLTPVEHDPFK